MAHVWRLRGAPVWPACVWLAAWAGVVPAASPQSLPSTLPETRPAKPVSSASTRPATSPNAPPVGGPTSRPIVAQPRNLEDLRELERQVQAVVKCVTPATV